jgi:hypothetical protein
VIAALLRLQLWASPPRNAPRNINSSIGGASRTAEKIHAPQALREDMASCVVTSGAARVGESVETSGRTSSASIAPDRAARNNCRRVPQERPSTSPSAAAPTRRLQFLSTRTRATALASKLAGSATGISTATSRSRPADPASFPARLTATNPTTSQTSAWPARYARRAAPTCRQRSVTIPTSPAWGGTFVP